MGKDKRIFLAAWIIALAFVGLIFNADASAADKNKNPCSEDIAKFCKDAKSDSRSILQCLQEHENELSDACKAHKAKMGSKKLETREEIRATGRFRQACKEDIIKLCKDANPAGGGIIKCLKEHEKELSGPCGESLKAVMREKKKKE